MSEKAEDTNCFRTLNTQIGENVQGEGGAVGIIQKKKLLISSSPSIPEENYSVENKENYSIKINYTNNTMTVVDDNSASKEPQVEQDRERLSILLQEHSKDYTWLLPEVMPIVYNLQDEQLSPRHSENSSPVLKTSSPLSKWSNPVLNCFLKRSRHSYAKMLKSKSTPKDKVEVNYLKNILGNNSRLKDKEDEYLITDYKNPFGIIGKNVVDRKEPKTISELQRDISCKLNEENAFLEDQFPDSSLKIDLQATDITSLNYPNTEKKRLSTIDNYFWNKFLDVWQNYSYDNYDYSYDMLNAVDIDVFPEKIDEESSNSNKSDQCVWPKDSEQNPFNIRCPLNNIPIELCDKTCIETLKKDYVSCSDKDTSSDSSLEHNSYSSPWEVTPIEDVESSDSTLEHNSYSSLWEVTPIEDVEVPSESNYLNNYREIFKRKQPVLFIPLNLGLKQDAEAQETNLNNSPTRKAIERELSELWKETAQKSVDKGSENASHPQGQEADNESIQGVQQTIEDFQYFKEAQQFLNDCDEVKSSRMSNLSTVIKSSSLIIEKGFHYTDVTNHLSGHVSDACRQIVNDRLFVTTNNRESILDEVSNILVDYDSSCDFYKSVRNEVHREIEEINLRMSKLEHF